MVEGVRNGIDQYRNLSLPMQQINYSINASLKALDSIFRIFPKPATCPVFMKITPIVNSIFQTGIFSIKQFIRMPSTVAKGMVFSTNSLLL